MSAGSETVPFGKYKGRPVDEMLADADYMTWLEAQPWFRERFKHLTARRDDDSASSTPVHNRLQALFLNIPYCYAFARVAAPRALTEMQTRAKTAMAKQRADIEQWPASHSEHAGSDHAKSVAKVQSDLAAFDACHARFNISRTFEVGGCDVGISITHTGPSMSSPVGYRYWPLSSSIYQMDDISTQLLLRVEIKPSVADEYPAVLRQMARNKSEYLFLGQYTGEGVPEADFVAMFAASGLRVVFKRDVDAQAATMAGPAGK